MNIQDGKLSIGPSAFTLGVSRSRFDPSQATKLLDRLGMKKHIVLIDAGSWPVVKVGEIKVVSQR